MRESPSDSNPSDRTTSSGLGGCARLLIVAVVAGVLGGVAGAGALYFGLGLTARTAPPAVRATEPEAAVPTPVTVDVQTSITEAVNQVGPSVVTVVNFLTPQGESRPTGRGSGVIVTDRGHVVTNNHVVAEASELEIRLADGSRRPATLVGTDPFSDLAVLQTEGNLPEPAEWGNSDALNPGETVVAIGSPLGDFFNTVTVGVVSGVGRSIDTGRGFELQEMIQTDAAINQGNSGGPLVNLAGQVVGINTLIVRGSQTGVVAEGLGFAIPSNRARAVAQQIIETGTVARPFMGIEWRWITPQVSRRFDLPIEFGVLVMEVAPGSPADRAGLRRGDILTAVEGQIISADQPFINLLYEHEPGETIALTLFRDGEELQVEIQLGRRPGT